MTAWRRRILLAGLAAAAMTPAACGGSEGESGSPEPATTPAAAEEAAATATPAATEEPAAALGLGDATSLEGLEDVQVEVAILEVEDPMTPSSRERARAGRRFVGVHARFTNEGAKKYDDAVLNGSHLVTDPPKAANPSIVLYGRCRSKPLVPLKIAPGKSKKVCLPFQVKKKAAVKGFEFRTNSGYGDETGKWSFE